MQTNYQNAKLVLNTDQLESGAVRWRSPSNIALIKYWGKHGNQLPQNPSISLTLDRAATDTTLHFAPRIGADNDTIQLEFLFEGQEQPAFRERVAKYLTSLLPIFPFLRQINLRIETSNTFPHSSGIASSASGMSALALCLCSLERLFFDSFDSDAAFLRKASYVARLGSGSASRSIFPIAAVWGQTGEIDGSSDEFAIPYQSGLHKVFTSFHDDILIISRKQKAVSSRAGHQLMENNAYAAPRYQQARQRLLQLIHAMKQGDLEQFGTLLELEAFTLHALMMASSPSVMLLLPNTLEAIQRLRSFRTESNCPLYFTLDAGPNLHLLYPDSEAERVRKFVRESLLPLCEDQHYIADRVGEGPLSLDPIETEE